MPQAVFSPTALPQQRGGPLKKQGIARLDAVPGKQFGGKRNHATLPARKHEIRQEPARTRQKTATT